MEHSLFATASGKIKTQLLKAIRAEIEKLNIPEGKSEYELKRRISESKKRIYTELWNYHNI